MVSVVPLVFRWRKVLFSGSGPNGPSSFEEPMFFHFPQSVLKTDYTKKSQALSFRDSESITHSAKEGEGRK